MANVGIPGVGFGQMGRGLGLAISFGWPAGVCEQPAKIIPGHQLILSIHSSRHANTIIIVDRFLGLTLGLAAPENCPECRRVIKFQL